MLSTGYIMLDTALAVKHSPDMLSIAHQDERPTRFPAGRAFFFVRRGDRLAVRTRGVHPRNVSSNLALRSIEVSGTVTVSAATAPDHQPRDLAPKKMTTRRNIAPNRSIFHTAAHFPQMTDLARHEYPRKIQAS